MLLARRFTPLNMLLLSVNGMVGSAWLFAPLYAAKITGPGAIIAWLIGGAVTILIALTFVETSTLFPAAGGSTQIPQLSHGPLTSFTMGWISWLSSVTMPPIEVQAVLQYASNYFHSLTHVVNGAPVLTSFGLVWACFLLLILSIVNVVSFKGLVGFNRILFYFKVIVMLLACVFLVKTSFHLSNFMMFSVDSTSTTNWQNILVAVATGGIAFAFTGFKHGVELAGETTNTQRALPLAIIGSIVICLLLYLGLQVAFLGVLNPSALHAGWAHLAFAGDFGPFAGIAAILGLVWLTNLLYMDAVVSPLGAGLVYVTSTSRIIYAMSKNSYLPEKFSQVNSKNFPMWAIGLNFVVGMFLFLPLPGWQNMVSFLVSAVVISYTMGPITLLCFRKQLPQKKRAFRLPFAPVLSFVAFYFCNLMCYWTGWETINKLVVALAIGFGVFFLNAALKKNNWKKLGLKALVWLVPYLLGMGLISYFGSFGGTHLIAFGYDFFLIAIFSLIMLFLAVKVSAKDIAEKHALYLQTTEAGSAEVSLA